MSSTNAPFGLRPAKHMSGDIRIENATIASGYASALYKHCPVKMLSDGTIGVANPGDAFIGVFMGVDFIDATGRPQTGFWPAGQTVQTGTIPFARITRDPNIIYEIQGNNTLSQTHVGNNVDMASTTAGDAVTYQSQAVADASTVATTTKQLQILDFAPGPLNAAGDTYPVLQVRIYNHQLAAAAAAGV